MLNISIKVTGKPIQEFINDLNVTIDQINKDVAMAGKRTLDWMITIIEARKTRSGAEHWDTVPLADALEQSSEVTPTVDGIFVGIGEIAKLNYSAKHWAYLNYGKMRDGNTIPARGKFVPGYWEGDKFIYEPGSGTGMVPKTPIFGLQGGEPINYIEEGENFITKQINDIIAKAKNRMER